MPMDPDPMQDAILRDVLPDMLTTQLLAADLYSTYMKFAVAEEYDFWKRMMLDELAHIRFVSLLMDEEELPFVPVPELSIDAFRDLCRRARDRAMESTFERTLWSLRVEYAEIDFGLEAVAIRAMREMPDSPVCTAPINEHYRTLVHWARRYEGASEIAIQIARIGEHFAFE